ncbi:hypothetical protein PAMC26577_04130 [Caballeronia sordidicola]|uniref:Uncharacterized protein n=1 Tax=Caballeronia sordidicola TaxID=196367 RepID=A0A242N564_CABSO|nr:hypothetical protein PAMC26577_04130 [Caballeronia sordidicola]
MGNHHQLDKLQHKFSTMNATLDKAANPTPRFSVQTNFNACGCHQNAIKRVQT